MKKQLTIPIIVFISVIILFNCVFYIGYVPTASMSPTIKPHDRIWGVRIFQKLTVGDIIVFRHKNAFMVKRIAACPRDTINISGEAIEVPKHCYYVLGDNPDSSYDSRNWENPFVDRINIKAKIFICY